MRRIVVLALFAATSAGAAGNSVRGSKHDLSVSGPGPIRSLDETNVCLPCHVTHSGMTNRPDLRAIHIPYESTTIAARPGAPTGATRICLSCHDGTIAVGETRQRMIPMTVGTIPADRKSNIGTDLRRTHPVSFRPVSGGATRSPPPGDAVKLDHGGQVQCTSCHDPHVEFADPLVGKFLVKPSQRSALCLSCHDGAAMGGIGGSSHANSGASFGQREGNTAGFGSVAEAGCVACHVPHGGDVRGRLVTRPSSDDSAICLRCHSGNVARQNIAAELSKPSSHAGAQLGVHDAAEGRPGSARPLPETSPGALRHATCIDCHNPHAASDRLAAPGGVSGLLAGVWGIDRNGQRVEQVRFEYEVCFKCHADSANKPQSGGLGTGPRRAVVDANLRSAFAPTAASYHPVVGPGRNPSVPSLKAPYTPASMISCTDCHASESGPGAGGSGPRGPHGSAHEHLLERNLTTADNTPESEVAYALCYKCHDRPTLVDPDRRDTARFPQPTSFAGHRLHVVQVRAPCTACHAPHGVSLMAGTPSGNAHLVDFDTAIVQPFGGLRTYQSAGPGRGSCSLSCHGKDHDRKSY